MNPFVVHMPESWSKLRKLIKKCQGGYAPVYRARCGEKVELPPFVRVERDDDARMMGGGYYFVAGPHERYYTLCKGCLA